MDKDSNSICCEKSSIPNPHHHLQTNPKGSRGEPRMAGAGDGPDGYRPRADGPKPRDRGPGAGGSARTEP